MSKERNAGSDERTRQDGLPEEVLNNAADPNSFKDPLEVQLEKSKSMNSEEQKVKLDIVKEKNRGEG